MVAVTTKKKVKKTQKKTTVGSNGAATKKQKKMTSKEVASRKIVGMKRAKIINPNANSWGMIDIGVEGTNGLMVRQFSTKIEKILEDKHAGKPTGKRPPKDKIAECLDSFHVIGPRPTSMAAAILRKAQFGFPATAFKHAMEKAAIGNGFKSTEFRRFFRIESDDGYLIALKTSIPTLDSRWVRNANRMPDIRHRPIFSKWSATLRIWYNARLVTAEQIVVFCDDAGATGGIGELRPGKSSAGDLGTWKITSAVGDVPEFE